MAHSKPEVLQDGTVYATRDARDAPQQSSPHLQDYAPRRAAAPGSGRAWAAGLAAGSEGSSCSGGRMAWRRYLRVRRRSCAAFTAAASGKGAAPAAAGGRAPSGGGCALL
ncbi:hypothetical protein MNEG_4793 [Monoraphidium neglectum]|jgi:hypothetical protein|uniref:Uncharacterized protein n=1 Tax=Monoraphidium neglectum TaxID=145388 RepID=A0A0D2L8N3_9CHLO|nr:hypothetical protein MNEG_4793 [Monoraphidium neglectum]KIZ03159.1 hypothetical protein MNEG_4793 [Monoraphidium neglectum]|eukprot:XP_013902178.1 hypothetical protein MNEG_4793 [Monoraphidium neglectum]